MINDFFNRNGSTISQLERNENTAIVQKLLCNWLSCCKSKVSSSGTHIEGHYEYRFFVPLKDSVMCVGQTTQLEQLRLINILEFSHVLQFLVYLVNKKYLGVGIDLRLTEFNLDRCIVQHFLNISAKSPKYAYSLLFWQIRDFTTEHKSLCGNACYLNFKLQCRLLVKW